MNLVGEWGSLAFFVPFPKVGSIPVSVDTVPTSPRNALYGFCARALPTPPIFFPARGTSRERKGYWWREQPMGEPVTSLRSVRRGSGA